MQGQVGLERGKNDRCRDHRQTLQQTQPQSSVNKINQNCVPSHSSRATADVRAEYSQITKGSLDFTCIHTQKKLEGPCRVLPHPHEYRHMESLETCLPDPALRFHPGAPGQHKEGSRAQERSKMRNFMISFSFYYQCMLNMSSVTCNKLRKIIFLLVQGILKTFPSGNNQNTKYYI